MLIGENLGPHDVILSAVAQRGETRRQGVSHLHLRVQMHDLVMVIFSLQLFAYALLVKIVILHCHI